MQDALSLPATVRRRRQSPQPTGKRLILGDRDTAILQNLWRYRYLTTDALVALIQPRSAKRFVERLGDLFHETGLINRPPQQWDQGRGLHHSCVYELSRAGAARLMETDAHVPRAVISQTRAPRYRVPNFSHALATSQFLANEDASSRSTEGRAFVPAEVILDRRSGSKGAPHSLAFDVPTRGHRELGSLGYSTRLIPDALYGIAYQSAEQTAHRFFAVEIELTTPLRRRTFNKSSTLKKLLCYKAALRSQSYRNAFGIPNLFPVFVGRNDQHREHMKQLAKETLTPEELALFRFATCPP